MQIENVLQYNDGSTRFYFEPEENGFLSLQFAYIDVDKEGTVTGCTFNEGAPLYDDLKQKAINYLSKQ